MNLPRASHTLLIITALALAACSSSPERPQWLDAPAEDYPNATHLSAVGQADERQLAAERAQVNLAKQFAIAIEERSIDISSAQTQGSGDLRTTEFSQTSSRAINAQVQQLLEGAVIADYWQSPADEHFALAVLDKAVASQRLRQDISAADRRIAERVAHASTRADNPVSALRALAEAQQLAASRELLNRQLMVTSGQGIAAHHSIAHLETTIRNALATLSVGIEIEGLDENNAALKSALQHALNQLGVKTTSDASLTVRAQMDTTEPSQQAGWYWLRGAYTLSLIDAGQTLSEVRKPLKVSALQEDMVPPRLRDEIAKTLTDAVFELFATVRD